MVDIDMSTRTRLLEFYREVLTAPESTEMEALLLPGRVDHVSFTQLLKYLVSVSRNPPTITDQLNVMFTHKGESYRLEIDGVQNIASYCRSDVPQENNRLIKKSIASGYPPIREKQFKVNLKRETEIDNQRAEVLKSHRSSPKRFRLKRRYSFLSEDEAFRYDLTLVKSSVHDAVSMAQSGVTNTAPGYEIEVEYVGNRKRAHEDAVISEFVRTIYELLFALRGDDAKSIVSEHTKKSVLASYKHVTKRDDFFIGPMPVTLERQNMARGEFWDYHILDEYTVTDKADGERRLLFIHTDGLAYMIDKDMNVTGTGASAPGQTGAILDGEYITASRHNTPIKLFAIFDCYYNSSECVASQSLKKRLVYATSIAEKMNNANEGKPDVMRVKTKEFYDNIFQGAEAILSSDKDDVLSYKIDGLVYTPKNLPVGAMFRGKSARFGGTWPRVFKWKPPEQNSIDFLVKVEKNEKGEDIVVPTHDGGFGKVLSLFVGFKGSYTKRITPEDYMMGRIPNLTDYYNELFKIPPKDLSKATVSIDKDGIMHCLSGEVITHNAVVEMVLVDERWIPMRLRKDKVKGNDYNTAVNIYNSIMHPVTEDDVKSEQNISLPDIVVGADDAYYKRIYPREMSATLTMIEFHNQWVKRKQLIERFRGRCSRVFDVACGAGGDLGKFLTNNFKVIVGVDKSTDNISNGKDGAYARLLQNPRRDKATVVFMPMDFGKPFDVNNETVRYLLTDEGKSTQYSKKYAGIIGKKFDLVSCQFAIHYFMESKSTLRIMVQNIARVIEDGGYFVGTCLDASAVDAAFNERNVPIDGSLTGMYDTRVIWNITKLYDRLDASNNYQKKIKVYLETINQSIDEYLVDMPTLERELARVGIMPLTIEESKLLGMKSYTGMFGDVFEEMKTSQNVSAKNIVQQLTVDEKKLSFLNRWFVFKKHESPAPSQKRR
jgi:hypothetical protein